MNNIQPWCISRQLWWGHQIPAWFHDDGTIFVAETEKEAYEQAKKKYGKEVKLTRDPDVLDVVFICFMAFFYLPVGRIKPLT